MLYYCMKLWVLRVDKIKTLVNAKQNKILCESLTLHSERINYL